MFFLVGIHYAFYESANCVSPHIALTITAVSVLTIIIAITITIVITILIGMSIITQSQRNRKDQNGALPLANDEGPDLWNWPTSILHSRTLVWPRCC